MYVWMEEQRYIYNALLKAWNMKGFWQSGQVPLLADLT